MTEDECSHGREIRIGADATFFYFRCELCGVKWQEGR